MKITRVVWRNVLRRDPDVEQRINMPVRCQKLGVRLERVSWSLQLQKLGLQIRSIAQIKSRAWALINCKTCDKLLTLATRNAEGCVVYIVF